MTQWSKERIQVTSMLILFFLTSLFFYPLLVDNEYTYWFMSISFIVIIAFTFMAGTVLGLLATLLYIFIFGTALFFVHLTDSEMFPSLMEFPIFTFFIQSVVLLVAVLLAGALHNVVGRYDHEQRVMRDRLDASLTIDLITGFNSNRRFIEDMASELSRAKRYDETVSLIMLELDYFSQFRKLYGEQETQTMIRTLAKTMENAMRISDRKYRLSDQRFVLLLPHTDEGGTEVVLLKLKEVLMNYKLLNQKTITLQYHASTYTYDGMPITVEEIVKVMESELKSGAL